MISTKIDAKQYRLLMRAVLRQFPYATVQALNTLALRFQRLQRNHQRNVFNLRQKQYFNQSVKIPRGGFASVREKRYVSRIEVDPKATGGVKKFDIWERQEYGGKRRPVAGRKKLAIPPDEKSRYSQVGLERTGRGLIPKRLRPQNLKRTFVVNFSGGKLGLFRRISKRQKGYTAVSPGQRFGLRDDPNVQLMYVLHSSAKIDAVYDWQANAKRIHRQWPAVFNYELERAFRQARIPGAR